MIILLQWPLGNIVDCLLKSDPKEHAYPHTLLGSRSSVRLRTGSWTGTIKSLAEGPPGVWRGAIVIQIQVFLFAWAFSLNLKCAKQRKIYATSQNSGVFMLWTRSMEDCRDAQPRHHAGGQTIATAIGLWSPVFSASQKNIHKLCFILKESLGVN